MRRRSHAAASLALALALATGCGGAATGIGAARVADAERMKKSLDGQEASKLAPQAYAVADGELRLAKDANAHGDALGAELHAERALAAYNHAVVLARLARTTEEAASATEALARASEQAGRFSALRKAVEREADDLEKQLKIAREARLPAPSGRAEPDREKARLVAAQALVTQARLLCSAARLVSPEAPGLRETEATVADLDKRLEAVKGPVPIDAAARARASCLASLTKARRAAASADEQTDALLAELSESVAAGGASKASPHREPTTVTRDERGIVVTMRGLWKGESIAPEGRTTLEELGRVAAAHPTFAVQVVVHDAQAPSAAEKVIDQRRGEAAVHALVDGGAAAGKIEVEQAGARAPVVDPGDTKRRERNARVEVVFVVR